MRVLEQEQDWLLACESLELIEQCRERPATLLATALPLPTAPLLRGLLLRGLLLRGLLLTGLLLTASFLMTPCAR